MREMTKKGCTLVWIVPLHRMSERWPVRPRKMTMANLHVRIYSVQFVVLIGLGLLGRHTCHGLTCLSKYTKIEDAEGRFRTVHVR